MTSAPMPDANPAIEVRGLTQRFATSEGSVYTACQDIDLTCMPSGFTSIVGPSGCGKSTILNVIAGLTPATSGKVNVFGEPLRGLNRNASYVFQQDALLPWLTVLQNTILGLTFRGYPRNEANALGRDWLARVALTGFENSFPYQLSGGMRKRVALAQALIIQPDIVLMDEPFGALDAQTRLSMQEQVLELWAASNTTIIFVTHDLDEAIFISDEVLVMSAGPASRIVLRHEVPLERPRDLMSVRLDRRFTATYNEIWETLRNEVLASRKKVAAR
jgi:NitT/TauT family transport system ATP-binding protein